MNTQTPLTDFCLTLFVYPTICSVTIRARNEEAVLRAFLDELRGLLALHYTSEGSMVLEVTTPLLSAFDNATDLVNLIINSWSDYFALSNAQTDQSPEIALLALVDAHTRADDFLASLYENTYGGTNVPLVSDETNMPLKMRLEPVHRTTLL